MFVIPNCFQFYQRVFCYRRACAELTVLPSVLIKAQNSLQFLTRGWEALLIPLVELVNNQNMP